MRLSVRHLLVTTLCGASFAAGAWLTPAAPVVSVEAPIPEASLAPRPWREALDAARADPTAEPLRAAAHEALERAGIEAAVVAAVRQLGVVGGEDDLPLLLTLLEEGSPATQEAAARALGAMGGEEAAYVLMDLAKDEGSRVSWVAYESLGQAASPLAWDFLVARLDRQDVGDVAAEALGAYGTPEAARALTRAFERAGRDRAWGLAMALARLDPTHHPAARASLHKALRAGARHRQEAAMNALAYVRDPGVLQDLLAASGEGSVERRSAAINALSQLGDPAAVPELSQIALTGPYSLRGAAIYALAGLDHPEADAALLRLLRYASPDTASTATNAVRDAADPAALDALLWAAEHPHRGLRDSARYRLFRGPWDDGAPAAVLELARAELALGGGSWQSASAVRLLGQHGTDEDRRQVSEAVRRGLGSGRADAIYALQDDPLLLTDDMLLEMTDAPDSSVRSAAFSALNYRGATPEVEERLLYLLEEDSSSWGEVEAGLANLDTPAARAALMKRVIGGSEEQSRSALSALAGVGDTSQLEALTELLEETEDPGLKRRLYETLMYAGDDSEAVVLAALEESDPGLREMGTYALERITSEGGRRVLEELVDEGDPHQRASALSALAGMGGPEAEQRLLDALEDPELSGTALSGLQSLGTPGAREALMDVAARGDDPDLRSQAIYQLGWSGGGSQTDSLLVEALSDGDEQVRGAALSALSSRGTADAAEALIALVADGDPDDPQVIQAASAVRSMGGGPAREYRALLDEVLDAGAIEPGDEPFAFDTGMLELLVE